MQKILITLFNPNGKPRWYVYLTQLQDGTWEINDNSQYSLFNNPLSKGTDPGDCLNNFLKVEEDLINGL